MKSLAFALATAAAVALSGPVWADAIAVYPPGQNQEAGPGNVTEAQQGNPQCVGYFLSNAAQTGGMGQYLEPRAASLITSVISDIFTPGGGDYPPSPCDLNP